jgi:hypothetical protein
MKKLSYFFMCMAILALHSSQAQYYYNPNYYEGDVIFDVGLSPGIMNCLTDIGGKKGVGKKFLKDLNWVNTRPCFSIYAAALYRYAITAGVTATFGSVQAYDSILKSVIPTADGRYERNLSFRSPIFEIRLSIEVHPIYLFNWYQEGHAPRISPYLSAGLGFFHFNPEAEYEGRWYQLHQLHTEGEGFPGTGRPNYSLNQINIPLGIGIRYEVSDWVNMHLELMHRILFTDYLDDVSTTYIDPALFFKYLPPELAVIAYHLADRRGELDPSHVPTAGGKRGDPNNNDAFFSIQIKVGIVLGRIKKVTRFSDNGK